MAEAPNTRQPCTIVTGSSRGIGRAIATGLAKDGHRLVLTARDAALLDEVANELRAAGTEATTVVADLRSPNAVAKVLAAAEAAYGAADIIISNAGTAPSDKVENTTREMMQEAFDLHVAKVKP